MRYPTLILMLVAGSTFGAVNIQRNGGADYATILFNGPSATKYDIVFIGDGFTLADQATFNARVDDAVAALRTRVPYSERMCALNIWRVNVVSSQSGVDHPKDGIFKNTELDCRYGLPSIGEAERCITSDSPAKCIEAADYAPDHDAVFVLVNDTQWGGCAGGLVFSSISPGFDGIITHELGHKIGMLADEYNCYVCDGSDDTTPYVGPEPSDANITKEQTFANIKWNDLITPGTPLPTTVNSPPGVVGAWEGAGYKPRGLFRPQATCHMLTSSSPFCAVCEREMRRLLGGRCTICELNPSLRFCQWREFLHRFKLVWDRPYRWRWPWPPCYQCPPDDIRLTEEIIYVLKEVPDGFQLRILNNRGDVVAEGRQGPKGLQVAFSANRAMQYYVELTSPEKATGQALNISSDIFRNGVLEAPLNR